MSLGPVPIRVAVAEDQALVRNGFVALLASDPAIELARRTRPDVMLMDIRMPGWTASAPPPGSPPIRTPPA